MTTQQVTFIDKDHLIRELELHIAELENQNRKAAASFMENAELIKRAFVAEERTRELIEEQSLREKYMATLTHDLRTPLVSSRLCAKMLDGAIVDVEKKQKLYKTLVSELERADQMIHDLLDYSKTEGEKKFPFIKKKLNLESLARKCIENIHTSHPNVHIHLRCDGEIVGKWSKDGLQRVLENLLSNAIKYGNIDEPIIVVMTEKTKSVNIEVHNDGEPIPQKEQKTIFEAFHRSSTAFKTETLGWGLGLSLVHTIIEGHQGKIRVKSSPGTGTSFIIDLPKHAE